VFNCPIEELLIESSNRATDQGEVLSKMIEGLSETDRAFMLEHIEKMANKLKDKTPAITKRSKKA
jgi:hypothetical protein